MNKENFNKTLESTVDHIKDYINLKTELYTLILFERVAKMLSKLFVAIIFVFFLFFFLLFISLGFINWFHETTGTSILGYVIGAFFYLILGFIIYGMSKRLFLNPMLKGFTDVLFEKEETLETTTKIKKKDGKDK
jgi:pilus assembly protein TadC